MEQPFGKFLMFQNRLEKVFKHLSRKAKKQNITCFRIYDHDIPEFPFIIEIYEGKLYVSEYKRNHKMMDDEHSSWLFRCINIIVESLHVNSDDVYIKIRQKKAGRAGQYQKVSEYKNEFTVYENGLKFIVNLSDYLDTGLFLDHRITRQMVKERSFKKNVLNLFCYTGSFSVYALAGNASKVVSIDLSNTYLNWVKRNIELNFPANESHIEMQVDVMEYLKAPETETFDLIILDPPTFSNSKKMDGFLDIQKDHAQLINDCLTRLSNSGALFFSTNYTRFQIEEEKINSRSIKNITKATIPFDFEGKLKRQCFLIESG